MIRRTPKTAAPAVAEPAAAPAAEPITYLDRSGGGEPVPRVAVVLDHGGQIAWLSGPEVLDLGEAACRPATERDLAIAGADRPDLQPLTEGASDAE